MSDTTTVWIIHFPATDTEDSWTFAMSSAPPPDIVQAVRDAGGTITEMQLPSSGPVYYDGDPYDDDGKVKVELKFKITDEEEPLDISGIDFDSITDGAALAAALEGLDLIESAVYDDGVLTVVAVDGYVIAVDGEKAFGEFGDYERTGSDTLEITISDSDAGDVTSVDITTAGVVLETYFDFYAAETYTVQRDGDLIAATAEALHVVDQAGGTQISRTVTGSGSGYEGHNGAHDFRYMRRGQDGKTYYMSHGPTDGMWAAYRLNGDLSFDLIVEDWDSSGYFRPEYDYAVADINGNAYVSFGMVQDAPCKIQARSPGGDLLSELSFSTYINGFDVTADGIIYLISYYGHLVKASATEGELWSVDLGVDSWDPSFTHPIISACDDGGVVFCWRTINTVSGYNLIIYKYNSSGEEVWRIFLLGNTTGELNSLSTYGNGAIVNYNNGPIFDSNQYTVYIDDSGSTVFNKKVFQGYDSQKVGLSQGVYGWHYTDEWYS